MFGSAQSVKLNFLNQALKLCNHFWTSGVKHHELTHHGANIQTRCDEPIKAFNANQFGVHQLGQNDLFIPKPSLLETCLRQCRFTSVDGDHSNGH